jgi:hypothetical protein
MRKRAAIRMGAIVTLAVLAVVAAASDHGAGPFAKEGFVTIQENDRLWVFRVGSGELDAFLRDGELARRTTQIGVGPARLTIKAPDSETIVDYITSMDGFETFVNNEGRLWVFREGSPALEQFCRTGKPEKHVTLVGAGPMGITIKAPDRETANAYLRVYARSL